MLLLLVVTSQGQILGKGVPKTAPTGASPSVYMDQDMHQDPSKDPTYVRSHQGDQPNYKNPYAGISAQLHNTGEPPEIERRSYDSAEDSDEVFENLKKPQHVDEMVENDGGELNAEESAWARDLFAKAADRVAAIRRPNFPHVHSLSSPIHKALETAFLPKVGDHSILGSDCHAKGVLNAFPSASPGLGFAMASWEWPQAFLFPAHDRVEVGRFCSELSRCLTQVSKESPEDEERLSSCFSKTRAIIVTQCKTVLRKESKKEACIEKVYALVDLYESFHHLISSSSSEETSQQGHMPVSLASRLLHVGIKEEKEAMLLESNGRWLFYKSSASRRLFRVSFHPETSELQMRKEVGVNGVEVELFASNTRFLFWKQHGSNQLYMGLDEGSSSLTPIAVFTNVDAGQLRHISANDFSLFFQLDASGHLFRVPLPPLEKRWGYDQPVVEVDTEPVLIDDSGDIVSFSISDSHLYWLSSSDGLLHRSYLPGPGMPPFDASKSDVVDLPYTPLLFSSSGPELYYVHPQKPGYIVRSQVVALPLSPEEWTEVHFHDEL